MTFVMFSMTVSTFFVSWVLSIGQLTRYNCVSMGTLYSRVSDIGTIGSEVNGGTGDGRTDRAGISTISHTGLLLLLLRRTCFSAGITGMTCREVADTSLSDLAGLAQYCSSRLRSQLRKQHSSTIPRVWGRRLLPLLVGLPEEKYKKEWRRRG